MTLEFGKCELQNSVFKGIFQVLVTDAQVNALNLLVGLKADGDVVYRHYVLNDFGTTTFYGADVHHIDAVAAFLRLVNHSASTEATHTLNLQGVVVDEIQRHHKVTLVEK